jgi:hypothetical protein
LEKIQIMGKISLRKRHGSKKYTALSNIDTFNAIKINVPKLKQNHKQIEKLPVLLENDDDDDDDDDDNYDYNCDDDEEENEGEDKIQSYENRKISNRNFLQKSVAKKIEKLENATLQDLLLKHSTYGISEHQDFSLAYAKLKIENIKSTLRNLSKHETKELFNFSFDYGFGAAAFVHYTWKQIVESDVVLDDTEITRIMLAKTVFNIAYPDLKPKDDVLPMLIKLDLNSSIAEFQLNGLGEFPIRLKITGVDAALVCCVSEQSRLLCNSICRMHVKQNMTNALNDGCASHSSFEIFGKF